MSNSCGWCKKANPVVEGLIEDGHDILMLDVAEPDNAKLRDELFAEYNVGEQIDEDDLRATFDYCYPGDSTSYTFSFSKNYGKVFMLEFSASW